MEAAFKAGVEFGAGFPCHGSGNRRRLIAARSQAESSWLHHDRSAFIASSSTTPKEQTMTTPHPGPERHPGQGHQHQRRQDRLVPDNIKGGAQEGARRDVQPCLITPTAMDWFVAAEGYDALGMPSALPNKTGIGQFRRNLDQIIANAEGASASRLEADGIAVTAAEATWAKPRTRDNSKQSRSDPDAATPSKAQPSTRSAPPPAGRHTRCAAPSPGPSRRSWA